MPLRVGLGFTGKRTRFLPAILIVLSAKLLGALTVYSLLSQAGSLQTRWVQIFGPLYPSSNFLYVFTHWDSGWFLWIAKSGYTDMIVPGLGTFQIWYSFFPAYPLLIRAISVLTRDYVLSAVLVSFAFGVVWIPIFQKICERYMPRPDAFKCTLLASFLPPVFLFTTVAYSEALFLCATLLAWDLHEMRRVALSSVVAAIASVSRIAGIFVLIPIVADSLARRESRAIAWSLIPIGTFVGYAYYLFLKTGTWFAYVPATPGAASLLSALPSIASNNLELTFLVGFVSLIGYLTFKTWDIDWRTALYASISFVANLGLGFHPSYLRHLSFIFPVWTTLRLKSWLGLAFVLATFYVISLAMWTQFLSWNWVG